MGKKSRRNNKNSNGGGPAEVIYEKICRSMKAHNFEEILKVETKYRHLDSFNDDPTKDACVRYAFGLANYHVSAKDEICLDRAIDYYERAKERMEEVSSDRHETQEYIIPEIGMHLALLYSHGRDMEKAMSSHRWFLANCNRHQVAANYVIDLSYNFNQFEKFEYTIEVLEGSMDGMKTFEEEVQVETNCIVAYIGCGEFLKAKVTDETRRSTDVNHLTAGMQSGRIEEGLCNYKAAIAHCRKGVAGLQKQEYDDSLSGTRFLCSVVLARTLLRHSADNEAEAFAIFQEELDRCEDPLDREEILFEMGTGYRNLNKWDQSIKALRQLCLSSTRPADGTMAPQANGAMAQTYLEQYCTDATLDTDQRTKILRHATDHSILVHETPNEMHLTQAQLFYFNGDKQQAYHHLKLYLDARLVECKLRCYTCKQRVRHGSVTFSCASCGVASYCGRKHQKMTWKNERICHKVLCPLLGYWRMAKKGKKRRESNGKGNEDRSEYVIVFETFFESICPMFVSSYYDGLTFVD